MAFPTTGVLDNFNRANENPLANGNWTSLIQTTDVGGLQLQSNEVTGTSLAASETQSYWSAATFGPDVEVFYDIVQPPRLNFNFNLWVRMTNPNSVNLNGYVINAIVGASVTTFNLYYCVNNAFTLLTAPTQAVSAGDAVGLSAVGTTITIWYKPSGGSWGILGTPQTDSHVTGTGRIGFGTNDAATPLTDFTADNFGGGTFIPSLSSRLLLLGVS